MGSNSVLMLVGPEVISGHLSMFLLHHLLLPLTSELDCLGSFCHQRT